MGTAITDIAKPRTSLIIGGARVKNRTIKGVAQTMAQMGLNPAKEIARLAVLAEIQGDLSTASTNWRFLQEYCDAKRKAIDPTENALKQKELMTLEELGEVKRLILYGGENPPESEKQFQDSIIEGDSLPAELAGSNSDNCPFA